jgi:hypothetical protein
MTWKCSEAVQPRPKRFFLWANTPARLPRESFFSPLARVPHPYRRHLPSSARRRRQILPRAGPNLFHGYRIGREPPQIVVLDRADLDLAEQAGLNPLQISSTSIPPPADIILPAIWVVLGGFDPLRSSSAISPCILDKKNKSSCPLHPFETMTCVCFFIIHSPLLILYEYLLDLKGTACSISRKETQR